MFDNQSDSLVSKVHAFNEIVYAMLSSDQSLHYLASEQRVKSLVYIPENTHEIVVLSLDIQFRSGVKFKLQRVVENILHFPDFDISSEASRCIKSIKELSRMSPHVREIRSQIHSTTNRIIRELGLQHLSLELLSIDMKSINLAESFPGRLLFSVHILCFLESEDGSLRSDALFWDVASADEWEEILRVDIIPDQQQLYLRSVGSDGVSRH